MSLNSALTVLERYGIVQPTTLAGPIRNPHVRYGNGLFVEEGTTNLVTNPSFEVGTTGWTSGGVAATLTRDTTRSLSGSASLRADWPTAGAAGSSVLFSFASTLAVNAAHFYSLSVYVPAGSPAVFIRVSGAVVTTVSTPNSTLFGAWQRLSVGFTTSGVAGAVNVDVVSSVGTTVGQSVFLDAVQVEQKAYATTYTDGSLATAWDAPGNLLPTAAQSFEDGTTGGWTAGAGTIANSAAFPYAGTKALLLTATGANANTATASGSAGVAVVPGRTYSATAWVRPSAARLLRLDVNWYTAAGTLLTSINGVANTGTAGAFTRQSLSAVAPATAAFANVVFASSDSVNADTFHLDAVRLEEGTGSASYRWTGAENASTSVRTAARALYPLPSTVRGPLTVVARVRVGAAPTAAREVVALTSASRAPSLSLQPTSVQFTSAVDVAGTVSVTVATGDDLFIAGVLSAAGTVYTAYVSQNGGAVLSNTSGASAAAYGGATTIDVGSVAGVNHLGGAVEQVLVYNVALTAAEVSALAFATAPTDFDSDPRIVFASGTPKSGTVTALTSAGSGRFRRSRDITTVAVDPLILSGAYAEDNFGAEYQATTGSSSGVGEGDSVTLDGGATVFTVTKVFSTGSGDSLFLKQLV